MRDNTKETIIQNFTNENFVENPYNDTLIFYEIGHIKRSEQKDYLYLLDRIEKLEIEVNLSKERIEDLDRHAVQHHHPKEIRLNR